MLPRFEKLVWNISFNNRKNTKRYFLLFETRNEFNFRILLFGSSAIIGVMRCREYQIRPDQYSSSCHIVAISGIYSEKSMNAVGKRGSIFNSCAKLFIVFRMRYTSFSDSVSFKTNALKTLHSMKFA